ncbi:hypothetical protein [uncultured Sulfitobacter sp.]|nr:hypothetical protein [uncultured Sulfitobacter sp.]
MMGTFHRPAFVGTIYTGRVRSPPDDIQAAGKNKFERLTYEPEWRD